VPKEYCGVLVDEEYGAKVLQDAKKEGLTLVQNDALLAEVAGLVEWPVVDIGKIDAEFMDVPAEVLSTAMAKHQKYFSLNHKNGNLAPRFIVVSNMVTKDKGKAVVAGNERVLRARLYDAKFFWDQDRKQNLLSRVPGLEDMVFHARLGTLSAKVYRAEKLLKFIVEYVPGADLKAAQRANRLAKADLLTGMVGEFPDLQGVMGRYYALHDGEPPEVADAIADHYRPQGPNDTCPTAPLSVAVALADKIDTLVGFFAIDEKPTGSRDPFALRRAALGVIRLVLENEIRLQMATLFEKSYRIHEEQLNWEELEEEEIGNLLPVPSDLLSFFADRLKVHLREQGVRHDLITAVFAVDKAGGGPEDDLVRLLARVEALTAFLATDDGANLLTAFKRAANILRIEEKKDGVSYTDAPDEGLLQMDEEKALARGLAVAGAEISGALDGEDFGPAMAALAGLRGPVDAFFDHVTVNCKEADLRVNRLRLLSQIRAALGEVADFSQVEG